MATQSKAQKLQDELFKRMTAEEKIKMTSQFFELGKKLNQLNDRKLNGNNGTPFKNRKNT